MRHAATARWLTLLALVAQAGAAWALDPARAPTQYPLRRWTLRDGLPSSVVQAITQAPDGLLWVGTDEGIATFDGIRFVRTTVENRRRSDNTAALGIGHGGDLVIATDGGGVAVRRPDGRFIQPGDKPLPPPHNYARTVLVDGERTLIGTAGGLFELRGDQLREVPHEGTDRSGIRSLLRDRAGTLWAAGARGLERLENDRLTLVVPALNLAGLAETPDGLWVGGDKGLRRYRDGALTEEGVPTELRGMSVRSLLQDRDGSLWVGTMSHGLARISPRGEVAFLRAADGLGSDRVRAIFEDAEGSLWIGTAGAGLVQIWNARLLTYGRREGIGDDQITSMRGTSSGQLWFSTAAGNLHRLEAGKVTALYGAAHGLPSAIANVTVDPAGDLYVLGGDNTLWLKKGERFERVQILGDGRPLFDDGDGSVWVLAPTMARLEAQRWVSKPKDTTLALKNYRCAFRGPRGVQWFAGGSSILEYRDGTFKPHSFDWSGGPGITSIYEDDQGVVWVGTSDSGLRRLSNGQVKVIDSQHGLVGNKIFALLDDMRGRLWINGPFGIASVPKQDIQDVLEDRRTTLVPAWYGDDEGIVTDGFVDRQSGAWRAPDGRLWFAGARGLVVVDPDKLKPRKPPRVLIESITVDGQLIRPSTVVRSAGAASSQVEIAYRVPTLITPQAMRFRHRLLGKSDSWVDGGFERLARYAALGPGDYQIEIQAIGRDGTTGDSQTVAFSLRLPFHRRPAFYVLMLALAGAMTFAVHRARVGRVRRELEAVMGERNRMAREIHDSLAQGFLAIQTRIECAEKTLDRDAGKAREHLVEARSAVRMSLAEARRSVYALRPSALDASGGLGGAISAIAEQLSAGRPESITVTGSLPALPQPTENHLVRVAQEAMANALRHAQARTITVTLASDDRSVRISVRDDGRGFDPQREPRGQSQGLRGMRERAAELGGTLQVRSDTKGGTEVTIEVPRP